MENSYSKDFWKDTFYPNHNRIAKESSFANFCLERTKNRESILDISCGDGRDSHFFGNNGRIVYAFDLGEFISKESSNFINFKKYNLESKKQGFGYPKNFFRNVYCRFVLHAVPEHIEDNLLFNANFCLIEGGKIFIEARSDKGEISENIHKHYRRLINMRSVIRKLRNLNFRILYTDENRGISVFNNEDPVLIRIVAEKIGDPKIKIDNKFDVIRSENKNIDLIDSRIFLKKVKRILDANDIPCFLIFGTLLGAKRDKNFIKHDKDVDLGIMIEYKSDIVDLLQSAAFSMYKIFLIRSSDNLISLSYKDQYIDLYFFRETPDFYNCDGYRLEKNDIHEGYSKIKFIGEIFNTVSDVERYLTYHYGESWMIPVKDEHAKF